MSLIKFKLPYGRTARLYFKVDSFWERKVKKILIGWLPCYNCPHRLHEHISYDHCSDWNGVCVGWSPANDYSATCDCHEFDFFSFIRYFGSNYKMENQS